MNTAPEGPLGAPGPPGASGWLSALVPKRPAPAQWQLQDFSVAGKKQNVPHITSTALLVKETTSTPGNSPRA